MFTEEILVLYVQNSVALNTFQSSNTMGLRRKRKKIFLMLLLTGVLFLILTRSGKKLNSSSSGSVEPETCNMNNFNISGHRIFHKGNQPMAECKKHGDKFCFCSLRFHFDLLCLVLSYSCFFQYLVNLVISRLSLF